MMGSQPLFLPAGGQGSSEQEVKGPLGSIQEVEAYLRAPMGEKKATGAHWRAHPCTSYNIYI